MPTMSMWHTLSFFGTLFWHTPRQPDGRRLGKILVKNLHTRFRRTNPKLSLARAVQRVVHGRGLPCFPGSDFKRFWTLNSGASGAVRIRIATLPLWGKMRRHEFQF